MMGCEDGPNQTFQPAAAKAGELQNGATGPSQVDPVKEGFDASFPGKSAQEICSADEKHARWAKMLTEDIIPPRKYAGIDMAKSDKWEGLTIEEAERVNCQAINDGSGGPGLGASHWGDNSEVLFFYDIGTHIAYQMVLQLGYNGHMKFKDRTGAHSYDMFIGGVILKDNKPFLIDWANVSPAVPQGQLTELYNAAMGPNGPGTAVSPQFVDSTNCKKDRGCLFIADDGTGVAYFGIRPLAIYFNFRAGTPQPVTSTPFQLYNFYVKNEPYGNLPMTLKLDAEGPTAAGHVGAAAPGGGDCKMRLGLKYGDFIKTCVRVTGVPALDDQNVNKLLGGRGHDFESFTFNVVGVNQNFTKIQPPFEVIKDTDVPGDNDFATDWVFDVRAKGVSVNDKSAGGALDLHGTGLMAREWARLVQADMSATLVKQGKPARTLGDPACVNGNFGAGCTGIEGFIIPGLPYAGDPANITALLDPGGTYDTSWLAPGDPKSTFCNDITNYSDCSTGAIWENARLWVIQKLGGGDVFNVPAEFRDRRYFFKFYAYAMIKYMRAYGVSGAATTPAQVQAQTFDIDSLFFDNSFGNQFDKLEYIERSFMTGNVGDPAAQPIDFEYGTDVKVGNQRYTNWFRRLARAEAAMFTVMATNKAGLPGAENNVNMTNLYGSPVLAAAWESFHCATVSDPANCKASAAPLMRTAANGYTGPAADGTPALRFYEGAWGTTIFHQGKSPITIDSTDGDRLAAKITLPNLPKPYLAQNATTNKGTPLQVLAPWAPSRPGIGFTIPISGTRDKVIQTAQLDFTGVLETYIIDYDMYVDPVTKKQDGTIIIQAIESSDFLGEVFVCQDGATGDVLHVGMYDSGSKMLDWIASHPGASDSCDMIVRYSPYNNYVDYVTSRANGVKVNINQGAGFGRVVDATLYNPVFSAQ